MVNVKGLINFKNFYLNPVAYYSKVWTNFDMQYHSHGYFEVMYVEEGSCDILLYNKVNEEKTGTETITLGKDMVMFINSDVFHRLVVKNYVKINNIEFERIKTAPGGALPDFISVAERTETLKRFLSVNSCYYVIKNAGVVLSPIKRIHSELSEGLCSPEDRKILLNSYIAELFIKMAAVFYAVSKTGPAYVKKVLHYINNHYTDEISLDEMIKPLGISKGYLRKIVKQETGKTILDIINEHRITRAKQLISNTEMPLIDIAVECGFNNRQNFYYIFKQITGQNPQAFRQKGADLYSFGEGYVNDDYQSDSETHVENKK